MSTVIETGIRTGTGAGTGISAETEGSSPTTASQSAPPENADNEQRLEAPAEGGIQDFLLSEGGANVASISAPMRGLTPEQEMLVLQKLIGISEKLLTKSIGDQIRYMEDTNRTQLKENLKRLDEMLRKLEKQRASRSRGGVFGWISKVATVVLAAAAVVAVAAAIVGTGGLAAGPAVIGLMALLSFTGAAIDLAGQIKSEAGGGEAFTLGSLMGSDVGAAALTLNAGALAGYGAAELGLPTEAVIAVTVLATVLQMALTMKLCGSPAMKEQSVNLLSRFTEGTVKVSMIIDGLAKVGEGTTQIQQADLAKDASEIHADMTQQEASIALVQKDITGRLEFGRDIHGALEALVRIVSESISSWGSSMTAMSAGSRSDRAMA